MNKTFLLIAFLIPVLTSAQNKAPIDSIEHYQKELSEKMKVYTEAIRNDEQIVSLYENLRRLRAASDNYKGYLLYTQLTFAEVDKLNADLNASGFPSMTGRFWALGYGFSFKKGRTVLDISLGAMGFNQKTKKDEEEFKASFSTLFEFSLGYDFIKNKKLNLYPYAGVGFRESILKYEDNPERNPSGNNPFNIIQNNRSSHADKSEFGYMLGVGLEFVITGAHRPGGTLIFAKAGTNRAFKKKAFDLEGLRYDPEFHPGYLVLQTGFKFFFR